MSANMNVTVGGLELKAPVVLASGVVGYGDEWKDLLDWDAVGAVVLKGVSKEPWSGNPPHRLAETPAGVVNAVGLENVGLEVFVREKLPPLAGLPVRVVANVVGKSAEEYREICEALDEEPRVDGLELNVSCPNVKTGGTAFGATPDGLRTLVRQCREASPKPLWVKLAPLVNDVVPCARAALAGGADALTVANTMPAMAIDINQRRVVLGNTYGGLSGPAVRPVILRLVHRIYQHTRADIIGSGGVDGWEAAAAYFLAGARAVSLGTVLFTNPKAPREVVDGLDAYLEREGFADVTSLVGALQE